MSNLFLVPSISNPLWGRYKEHENHPISVIQVEKIIKNKMGWYPDNVGLPAITFVLVSGKEHKWAYDKVLDRDKDFEKLLNTKINVNFKVTNE